MKVFPRGGDSPRVRPFAATAVAAWVVLWLALPIYGQVSPGKLSRVHHELEGSLNCQQCHSSDRKKMDSNCLSCHGGVAFLEKAGRGLHARVAEQDCATCHPDHAGLEFELIHWDEGSEDQFDHARAGWTLQGGHQTLECRACHKPPFQSPEIMEKVPRKDHTQSWLGLTGECRVCHSDPHQESLGGECQSCHSEGFWTPAAHFDHDQTQYPLTGRHEDVDCASCHSQTFATPAGTSDFNRVFHTMEFSDCSSCHQDVHSGKFGATCADCHSTQSFKAIDQSGFNHDQTRYPLRGAHKSVECASCHTDSKTVSLPAFAQCADCHQDPHAGTALLADAEADCAACHSVNAFTPSSFTVEQHAATEFPLEGLHAGVACSQCHGAEAAAMTDSLLGSARVDFHPPFGECTDCHGDPHGDQLAQRDNDCSLCHSPAGFSPSTFSQDEHALTGFVLSGEHTVIDCAACHGKERPGLPQGPTETLGQAGVWLTPSPDCQSCHLDAHGEATSVNLTETPCALCHSAHSFSTSLVDPELHSAFGFDLTGAHAAVPCILCHGELERIPTAASLLLTGSVSPLPFSMNRSACQDCHEDPHQGQFDDLAANKPADCSQCHGTAAFSPTAGFDHNRDSSFPLEGEHARVECSACHQSKSLNGVAYVAYKPLDGACESCHQ